MDIYKNNNIDSNDDCNRDGGIDNNSRDKNCQQMRVDNNDNNFHNLQFIIINLYNFKIIIISN